MFVLACALAALGQRAPAQMPDFMTPPYLPPAATVVTVIRAGRLVDVEKGVVLRDQVIVVRGDKIASIEPAPGTRARRRQGHRSLEVHRDARAHRLPHASHRRR